MTALAGKLKQAGVDTVGARLVVALTEGVRLHPESVAAAWRHAGETFGYELARNLMRDMQPEKPQKDQKSPRPPISSSVQYVASKPYTPRVIPKETLERRRKQAEAIKSKYRAYDGRSWNEVGVHEAQGMLRQGVEVKALLHACPSNIPNDGRTFGDVLGVKRIDEIIAAVRKGASHGRNTL